MSQSTESVSQFIVGIYYAKGKSVEHSLTKTREWWTKAAKQGHGECTVQRPVGCG